MPPQTWQISSGGCWSAPHDVQRCTTSAPDVNQASLNGVRAGRAQSGGSTLIDAPSDLPEQQRTARCVVRTRDRQAQLGPLDLARRLAADLADGLDDVAETVDVRLTQVAAGGVDRQPTVRPLDVAVGHEGVELLRRAETHLGDRHERRPGEVLVELGDRNIGRGDPAALPDPL